MKIGSLYFLLVTGVLLLFAACEGPPEFPSVPTIEFESVEYKEVSGPDSLIVAIKFQDNEGDLGFNRGDDPTVIIYPKDASGNLITYGSSSDLPSYNVCDYVINPTIDGVLVEDTVLFQIDENSYNIYLKFFKKVGETFQEFDFRREFGPNNCFTMDGRFLRLNTRPQDRPLEGSLRYGMTSHVFGTTLRPTDILMIQVQIRDNSFQKSNIVSSPEFTLEGIKTN
jgi:hypothetical protein